MQFKFPAVSLRVGPPERTALPIVSIVVPFLADQNLYYRILTIKLVNQKRNCNGDSRYGLEIESKPLCQGPELQVLGVNPTLNPEPLCQKSLEAAPGFWLETSSPTHRRRTQTSTRPCAAMCPGCPYQRIGSFGFDGINLV